VPWDIILAVGSILAGLASSASAVMQGNAIARQREMQQRQLQAQARAEEVRAKQMAAEKRRRLNQTLAFNLAAAGHFGIQGGGSLQRVGEEAAQRLEDELEIDRENALLRAQGLRVESALISPAASRAAGYVTGATRLLKTASQAYSDFDGEDS
jgi:hypothetical protein